MVWLPMISLLLASLTLASRIIGRSSPLTVCVKSSNRIWGMPGISATIAPIRIRPVKMPMNIGASRNERESPFSKPKATQ